VSAAYNQELYLEPFVPVIQDWTDHLDHLRQLGRAPNSGR
jgi:hypothetical protein